MMKELLTLGVMRVNSMLVWLIIETNCQHKVINDHKPQP
jgi:hypothetical protein